DWRARERRIQIQREEGLASAVLFVEQKPQASEIGSLKIRRELRELDLEHQRVLARPELVVEVELFFAGEADDVLDLLGGRLKLLALDRDRRELQSERL